MPVEAQEKAVIVAEGLGKCVQLADGEGLRILQDISLRVMSGESLSIVGASGSGKSTLLGLLAGLDSASSGEVWLDGEALGTLDEDQRTALRARRVGFVFQSFQLLPALTALENVALPLELAGKKQARQQAAHWLDKVGLGQRLQHTPRQLSGGEQQRVALARAFAASPALIFADEPTGNLDATTGAQIIEQMFRFNAEQGATLIIVTHDTQIAARCQRQLHLEAGRMVDGGAPSA